MKRYLAGMAVVVMAAAVAFGTAVAGQAQAGHERAGGNAAAVAVPQVPAPDVNDYEYRAALETGTLSPAGITVKSHGSSKNAFRTVEAGGLTYRVGIDTN